jgi:acyl-CoA synthetase (AMP-forming)/AMP-acid ligase II
MFVGDWQQRREMLSPNTTALIDAINDNPPITYREWNRQANQLTNFFQGGLEIRKGDRVSICAMNRVECLNTLSACTKLAAVPQFINCRSTTSQLGQVIVVLKPGASLAEADLTDWLRERMAHDRVPESVVFLDTFPRRRPTR